MDEEAGQLTEDDFVFPPIKYEYLDHTADVQNINRILGVAYSNAKPKEEIILQLCKVADSSEKTESKETQKLLFCHHKISDLLHASYNYRLHAWGDSLKEAFEQCGMAMFGYMTDLNYVEMKQVHTIEASADDMLGLLYHFLDELLYLFSAEPFLICRKLQITEFNTQEFRIVCKCFGEEFQIGKHPQGTEVKAITYSAMQIVDQPKDNKFEVFVIIDI